MNSHINAAIRILAADRSQGVVTQAGILGKVGDTKASRQALRPDEVLFKQANAPERYEETDYYHAHERLPPNQQLPSGDLLSALHAYISKLYSRTGEPGAQKAYKCMDETALIAFGILMEETAKEVLGETGDLAFTEAAIEGEEEEEDEEISSNDENQSRHSEQERFRQTGLADAELSSDGSRYVMEESE